MKKLFYGFCCLVPLLSSTTLYAKENIRSHLLSNAITQQHGPTEIQQQFPKNTTTVLANPPQSSSRLGVYRSTTALPLFSEKLGLTDETNPLPFTIMLFGNYMQSTVIPSNFQGSSLVKDVKIKAGDAMTAGQIIAANALLFLNGGLFGSDLKNTDLIFGGDITMPLTGLAEVTSVKQSFQTGGIRFATNILPFWTVYGVFANTTGTVKTAVSVKDITIEDIGGVDALGPIFPGKPTGSDRGGKGWDALRDIVRKQMAGEKFVNAGVVPFTMTFDATSLGAGTTLSIGGDVFFTSLDANYVITAVDTANILVHTITASTRVGMYKRTQNGSFLSLWVGGNYTENIAGSDKLGAVFSVEKLGDLFPLEGMAATLMGSAPASLRWAVDQRPLSVFSAIIGMKYSPFPNFDVVTEINFIDRLTTMVSVAYNF